MVEKSTSIKNMVIKGFVIGLLICGCLTIFGVITFNKLMNVGLIRPSNYFEKKLPEVTKEIQEKGFNKNIISPGYVYAIYDKKGSFIEGSINEKEKIKIHEAINKNQYSTSLHKGILQIRIMDYKDKKIALGYTLTSSYKYPFLNKCLPNMEVIIISLPFINIAIIFYIVAQRISNRLKFSVENLIKASNRIKAQDLSFDIPKSSIKEIDLLNNAFEDMTKALENSLKKQWILEEERKTQISAITHDIKTPLMLISGHADLLLEHEKISDSEKKHINSILKANYQIENLIEAMLQCCRAENKLKAKCTYVNSEKFLNKIENQGKDLCDFKNIKFCFNKNMNILQKLFLDENLMERAILNIIKNAVEYTPEYGEIKIDVFCENNKFNFIVKDTGKGFSNKDVKYCKSQFYRGDDARQRDGHYGLGLYISDTIIKLHKGKLILDNGKDIGAIVRVII